MTIAPRLGLVALLILCGVASAKADNDRADPLNDPYRLKDTVLRNELRAVDEAVARGDDEAERRARAALRAEKSAVIDLLLGTEHTRALREGQVRALNAALRESVASELVVEIDAAHLREVVDGGYDGEAIATLAGALETHARYTAKAEHFFARYEETGNKGLRDHAGRLEAKAVSERDRLLARLSRPEVPAAPAPPDAHPVIASEPVPAGRPPVAAHTPRADPPPTTGPAGRAGRGDRTRKAARAQARRAARDAAALVPVGGELEGKHARRAARRAAREAARLAPQGDDDERRAQARKAARRAARDAVARAAPRDADLRRETRREARRAARQAARAAARDAATASARKAARRAARRQARDEAREEARRAIKQEAKKAEKRRRRKPKKIR